MKQDNFYASKIQWWNRPKSEIRRKGFWSDGGIGRDILHLHVQLQEELQLNLKTKNIQNYQKIELFGKSKTQGFKEATYIQIGRRHGDIELEWRGKEMWYGVERQQQWFKGQSHIHVSWIKIRKDTLGASNPSLRSGHIIQGSSVRKIKPHNFWL